ncbi:MAG TPA: glycosyltransferase family 9 protein [Chlamydiales bacterium]|nr:glycosyltransferase family 9 protein [Chlamydiales bacterium]
MNAILIIKIGAIGDVVMALPMLTYLRKKYPSAAITWVCGKIAAPLIAATGMVDHLLQVDEKLLSRGRIRFLFTVWKQLFGKSFDLVITAHPDPRYRWISAFCRKREHRFFDRLQKRPFPIPGRYHLDEYVRLAGAFEEPIVERPPFPKLKIPAKPGLNLPAGPIVVIAPGGAKNALADDALRRWPIGHYAQLIAKLSAHGLQIVITGSETDKWVEPHFSHLPFHNLIGQLSLLDLISLLQRSQLFITHDSGPLHLSKFASCPKIALFGPTNPYEKVSRSENIHVFWEGGNLPCSPCYDGKRYAPCTKNLCLHHIRPEQVAKKALDLLSLNTLCPTSN